MNLHDRTRMSQQKWKRPAEARAADLLVANQVDDADAGSMYRGIVDGPSGLLRFQAPAAAGEG